MKLLLWDCELFVYKELEHREPPICLRNVIVIFTCVEKGDDTRSVDTTTKKLLTVLRHRDRKIILTSFRHLSSSPAETDEASQTMKELVNTLKSSNINVDKTSLDYQNDFDLHFQILRPPESVIFLDTPVPETRLKFDVGEAMNAGVFVSGAPKSGKSTLGYWIADELAKNGRLVFVLDPSQVWDKSSIRSRIVVEKESEYFSPKIPNESTVFDISRLSPPNQKAFIETFCRSIWNRQAETPSDLRPSIFLIFDEAQLYIPTGSMRTGVALEIMRIISVGRNLKIRFAIITPFPSRINKDSVPYCTQIYCGRCDTRVDKEYLKQAAGIGDRVDELGGLALGEFLYKHGRDVQRIKVLPFVRK